MSAEIGPGTPLICINDGWKGPDGSVRPAMFINKGAIYFCEEVVSSWMLGCGVCGHLKNEHTLIYLKGHAQRKYCPKRFRPLNDGDTSFVADEVISPYQEPTNAPLELV